MKIKKILVSQPAPVAGKSPYYDIAAKYGFQVEFRPFIKVEGLSLQEFLAQHVDVLSHTAVIFTARHGIDHFFHLCEEMRLTVPEDMKYFCASETVALYLQKYIQYRKRKIFFSPTGKFADLAPTLKKHPGEKYLLVVSDVTKDSYTSILDETKVNYEKAAFYRTVSNDFGPDEKLDHDMLIFFSPEGIHSLKKNFPNYEQGEMLIAAFGAGTCKAVTDAGLRLDLAAPTPQYPSMTGALDAFCNDNKVNKK